MSYQLAQYGVIRLSDSLQITIDMPEWLEYRDWVRLGGIPIPMAAPAGPTVAEVLLEVKAMITAKRDAVAYGGATVGLVDFETDIATLNMLGLMVQLSAITPARVYKIKAADLVHIDKTAAEIADLFEALTERVALCWDNEAGHYGAVEGISFSFGVSDAAKIAALRAYDFSTGWPT